MSTLKRKKDIYIINEMYFDHLLLANSWRSGCFYAQSYWEEIFLGDKRKRETIFELSRFPIDSAQHYLYSLYDESTKRGYKYNNEYLKFLTVLKSKELCKIEVAKSYIRCDAEKALESLYKRACRSIKDSGDKYLLLKDDFEADQVKTNEMFLVAI